MREDLFIEVRPENSCADSQTASRVERLPPDPAIVDERPFTFSFDRDIEEEDAGLREHPRPEHRECADLARLRLVTNGPGTGAHAEEPGLVVSSFVLRLSSVLTTHRMSSTADGENAAPGVAADTTPGFLALHQEWWRFLHVLSATGAGLSFQIRLSKEPGVSSPIDVILVVRRQGPTSDDNAGRLRRFADDLKSTLLLASRCFELTPVTDLEQARDLLEPFAPKSLLEIAPREDFEPTSRSYRVAPFRARGDDMGRIVDALSCFPGAVLYAATIVPTEVTEAERAYLWTLGAAEGQRTLRENRRCLMRVHLAADRRIPAGIVESIGHSVAGYPGRMMVAESGPGDRYDVPRGGFAVYAPRTAAEARAAWRNLRHGSMEDWGPSIAPAHLRRARLLVDPIDAATAFRIPFPSPEACGGLRVTTLPGAPLGMPRSDDGAVMGFSDVCGARVMLRQADRDAAFHTYVVGKTGSGKSTLLLNLALSRINEGHGLALIDPHGDIAGDLLHSIPEEHADRVVVFDPAGSKCPLGLNLIEHDPDRPEQRSFLADQLLDFFDQLYDMQHVGGPVFETYFRSSLLALMEAREMEADITLVSRFFRDERFRHLVLGKCENPLLRDFWESEAEKATGDAALNNMSCYITSKLNSFLTNDSILPVVGQPRSAFDFREIIDGGRILVVRLSKGRLGRKASRLLGMVFVMRFLLAAMGREDTPLGQRRPFYLFIDEFQNLVTPAMGELLAESRKYALRVVLANQHLRQIGDELRASVLGNVGTLVSFRLGLDDAKAIAGAMGDPSLAPGLLSLPNHQALVRPTIDGREIPPFVVRTPAPPAHHGREGFCQMLIRRSEHRYGQYRDVVLREIARRYETMDLEPRTSRERRAADEPSSEPRTIAADRADEKRLLSLGELINQSKAARRNLAASCQVDKSDPSC